MKSVSRLIALTLAMLPAAAAYCQTDADSVRLHLALDEAGRLYLSTESENFAPPPLLQAPLPTLDQSNHNRAASDVSHFAIDLKAIPDSLHPLTPCFSGPGLSGVSTLGGCDALAHTGLPGVVHGASTQLLLSPNGNYGFDISYGLNWISTPPDADAWTSERFGTGLPSAAASMLLPGWVGPMINDVSLRSERMGAGGFLWLGSDLRLNFGYERANGALALLQAEPSLLLPWETGSQDSVSIGLDYGRLQGTLTGRQLRTDPGTSTSGDMDSLDLGFSWRMPWWNAALEFGARNLIVRPRKPAPDTTEPDQSDLRVPYLRYHQEL